MRESNSQSRLAKPMLSHLTNSPNLNMAPQARIELATNWLTANCSTAELPGNGAGCENRTRDSSLEG